MRWLKHLSASHEDEVLSALIEECGLEGYGFWWIVLEKIALQMDHSDRCSVRYSERKWSKDCRISVKKLRKFLSFLANSGRFLVEIQKNYITIACPNLLKYKDEYAQKSGHCRDKLPTKIQSIETETETEREIHTAKVGKADDRASEIEPKLKSAMQSVLRDWNRTAAECLLPKAEKWTDSRKRAARQRVSDKQWLADYASAMRKVAESDFCCGRIKPWRADFDWFLKPDTVTKLIEGKFDNSKQQPISEQVSKKDFRDRQMEADMRRQAQLEAEAEQARRERNAQRRQPGEPQGIGAVLAGITAAANGEGRNR